MVSASDTLKTLDYRDDTGDLLILADALLLPKVNADISGSVLF